MKKLAMLPAARIAVSAAVLMNGKGKMFEGTYNDGVDTMLGVVYPVAISQADLDAVQHWQNNGDFEMILITSDGELLITEGIAADYNAKKELPCKVVHHNEKS